MTKPTTAAEAAEIIAASVLRDLKWNASVPICTTHFSPACKTTLLAILSSAACRITLDNDRVIVERAK